MTSFAFMFTDVPAPPWNWSTGELVHATPVFDDFVAGGDDCLGLDGFHGLELHVRQGARLLNLRKRTNQFGCLVDGAA